MNTAVTNLQRESSSSNDPKANTLVRSASVGLVEQLAARFKERIRQQIYPVGARLPSVRASAQTHAVSAHTVVAAYDRLIAQGWVEARAQRGFFVRAQARPATGPKSAQNDPSSIIFDENSPLVTGSIEFNATENIAYRLRNELFTSAQSSRGLQVAAALPRVMPAPTHAMALVRAMFNSPSTQLQPSMGVLPAEWMDTPFLASAVRHVCAGSGLNGFSLEYGDPAGDLQLRTALAQRLAGFAIRCAPEQIVTTLGATHALDIASRTLLRAGDAVMVEEPGWVVEFARLAALGMRVLGVPRGPDGPDIEVMRRHCSVADPALRPKLFVSVSVLHNPTGACLSPSSAHQVLQLAKEHDFHILEDDTYAHFAPDHTTRIAAHDCADALDRVIYVGGFAKAIAPNWRIGFLAAPPSLVSQLVDTKMLATLTTPALLEKALARIIEQGQLRKHCERVRNQLQSARRASVKLGLQAGCRFAAEPAGLFGWVDVGADTDDLAPLLLDAGFLVAPGSLFYAERRPSSLMRVNFSATQTPAFWHALSAARDKFKGTTRR